MMVRPVWTNIHTRPASSDFQKSGVCLTMNWIAGEYEAVRWQLLSLVAMTKSLEMNAGGPPHLQWMGGTGFVVKRDWVWMMLCVRRVKRL